MIYIFRKEMKKWHTVLWIVFASLGLSGVSFFVFRTKHYTELEVARVNGRPVFFDEYRRSLLELQERINMLRPLAQAYGLPEDVFLSTFFGVSKPEDLALDVCIKQALIDTIKEGFVITLDEEWFKKELIKSLPQLTEPSGRINMDMYTRYLERLSMTPAEYEKRRKEDMKRSVIQRVMQNVGYVPGFITKDIFEKDSFGKSFNIAKFPLSSFLDKVKKDGIDDKTLDQFYVTNKENYRVAEKRKAVYWQISPQEYIEKTEMDPATVKHFYEKHKSSLFRIPPKAKVRHIFLSGTSNDVAQKARDIHQQVTKQPNKFADLAKQYSQDDKTAKNGGLVDFFGKGTYDAEFERAAFRLRNVGDLSPLIKTKQGYELIQLVERIQASEKPFESVKDEITKSLKAKRSMATVRADLEAVMRSIKEDPTALDRFVKAHNLKGTQTEMLTADVGAEKGIEGLIGKRLFSAHKRQSSVGYFADKDQYIVYQLSGSEKSFVPTLANVKDRVIADYYNKKADAMAKNILKDARTSLLAKKVTLAEIAQKHGATVIKTGVIKKGAVIKELGEQTKSAQAEMFGLTDTAQALEFSDATTLYLVQLDTVQPGLAVSFQEENDKIIKQEKNKINSLFSNAFIASLHRNAKIEIDNKVLESHRVAVKD